MAHDLILTTTYDTYLVEVKISCQVVQYLFVYKYCSMAQELHQVFIIILVLTKSLETLLQREAVIDGTYFPLAGDQDVQYGGACILYLQIQQLQIDMQNSGIDYLFKVK